LQTKSFDVAIVGGGPAGATAATMLRKFAPQLSVVVLERENFPRDHVGESLLPVVSNILNQMGCWEKVEAAGFPVKIGATYKWGSSDDLWDFDFLPGETYEDAPRPADFKGQRARTAFQVDRAIYDDILLKHASSLGAQVLEGTSVKEIKTEGDRITGLQLADSTEIQARYYLDCTGNSALLSRSLRIKRLEPSPLRNIAIWSYWQNADWAVKIGVSGTRIQVMSLGWGWIWFIPLGPTRTSIGLVVPAVYWKKSGKTPADLYLEALDGEPTISFLLRNASREEKTFTTKDWSFVSERIVGPNWFLLGEAAGFADPILSAGVTITQVGALEAAATIAELERGELDADWLTSEYEKAQKRRILTHIKFADFWYSANAHFTDLVEYTGKIAEDAGVHLNGKAAWQWLGSGGFVDLDMGGAGLGGFSLVSASWLVADFMQSVPTWSIASNNIFRPNLDGAEPSYLALFGQGRVARIPALKREDKTIPTTEICGFLLDTVTKYSRIEDILLQIQKVWCSGSRAKGIYYAKALQVFEAMVNDGWISAEYDPRMGLFDADLLFKDVPQFHPNRDNVSLVDEKFP
jgi:flavin-dependent dehydrogenase